MNAEQRKARKAYAERHFPAVTRNRMSKLLDEVFERMEFAKFRAASREKIRKAVLDSDIVARGTYSHGIPGGGVCYCPLALAYGPRIESSNITGPQSEFIEHYDDLSRDLSVSLGKMHFPGQSAFRLTGRRPK